MDKVNKNQLSLPLIYREVESDKIEQRLSDGYINATALCKAAGKKLSHYLENQTTKEFIEALSIDAGIPASALIQIIKGGFFEFQGTWVHPQVAVHLSQWASPKFAVLVTKWVYEWMSGNIPGKGSMPYHMQRYILNRTEIPPSHFSIFNEIMYNLVAPLEAKGYQLPDSMVPDISQGRMFAKWVREKMGLEPNDFPTYKHTYPDGRVIPNVKLYPNALLGDFRDHFYNVWIRERAIEYFKERDQNALPYLREMILELPKPEGAASITDDNLSGFNKSLKSALNYNPKGEKQE